MPTAAVRGIELFYERRGSGPPLAFLNGSGSTLEDMSLLIDVFAARFEVLGHDYRGMGRSSVPDERYSMADVAADVADLLDAVGWDTCLVVGVSFGGMVAQELAATWPDRVERLALVCTSAGGEGGSSYPLHQLADLPPDEQVEVGRRILDTRFTDEWLADHPSQRALADMMAERRRSRPTDPERLRGMALQMEARSGHDVWDRLGQITCPTLVASGRYDGIAPPANGERIASRIPGAELRLYDGGHAFFAQDPTAFPDFLAFLAGDA